MTMVIFSCLSNVRRSIRTFRFDGRRRRAVPRRFFHERRPDVVERHFDGDRQQGRHKYDDEQLLDVYLTEKKKKNV